MPSVGKRGVEMDIRRRRTIHLTNHATKAALARKRFLALHAILLAQTLINALKRMLSQISPDKPTGPRNRVFAGAMASPSLCLERTMRTQST